MRTALKDFTGRNPDSDILYYTIAGMPVDTSA